MGTSIRSRGYQRLGGTYEDARVCPVCCQYLQRVPPLSARPNGDVPESDREQLYGLAISERSRQAKLRRPSVIPPAHGSTVDGYNGAKPWLWLAGCRLGGGGFEHAIP